MKKLKLGTKIIVPILIITALLLISVLNPSEIDLGSHRLVLPHGYKYAEEGTGGNLYYNNIRIGKIRKFTVDNVDDYSIPDEIREAHEIIQSLHVLDLEDPNVATMLGTGDRSDWEVSLYSDKVNEMHYLFFDDFAIYDLMLDRNAISNEQEDSIYFAINAK